MSKRKLSRKQEWRAQKIQDERIKRAQNKLKNAEDTNSTSQKLNSQNARVVACFGTQFIVENDEGERYPCVARQNLGSIIVGDNILCDNFKQGDSAITAVLERTSLLERPNYQGKTKPVAANIDQMLIIASPVPALQTPLIDRYLVAVELCGIHPIIVINKIDLLSNEELFQLKKRLFYYTEIGYELLFITTKTRKGLSTIEKALFNKTSILVGQSGVGKSSTIKTLLPNIDIQIGEISKISKLGKHTTSASQMYNLPFDGTIIDSPGVRDFGLWHLAKENIAFGFVEFKPYLGSCKYSNCCHINEPQCAIIDAVKNKNIPEQRWKNYCTIYTALQE